jgi:hypothetical protein
MQNMTDHYNDLAAQSVIKVDQDKYFLTPDKPAPRANINNSCIKDKNQLQKMNDLIQSSRVNLNMDHNNQDGMFVSGIFGSFAQRPKAELGDQYYGHDKHPQRYQGPIQNSMIGFVNQTQVNCLDDLTDLLQGSKKLAVAHG